MGITGSSAKYGRGESSKLVLDTLKKVPFMQMMDDRLLHDLAKCFHVIKYAKGALIKSDGACHFYVVAKGSVGISILLPTSSTKKHHVSELLCQRQPGDYISYVAREQLVAKMLRNDKDDTRQTMQGGARKKLAALLEFCRTTADPFTGCTLLKLNFEEFARLKARATVHSVGMKNTARFSGKRNEGGISFMTAPEKLYLMGSIVDSDIVNYLLEIPFLERVEMTRLVMLANMCSYLYVRRGESVCVEGEIGDRFLICIKGTLQATLQVSPTTTQPTFTAPPDSARRASIMMLQEDPARTLNGKKIQALKRMTTGSYFGEISLVFKIPRVCSITALDDALLVYVDRTTFCNFLKVAPDAAVVLLEHIRLNFLDTLIKQGCPFLTAIPPLKLKELSYVSEIVDYERDTIILQRGEMHSGFYVLLRGLVEIDYGRTEELVDTESDNDFNSEKQQQNGRVIVHPGGYFGQEALILNAGSFVHARCLDHCLVLKLSPVTFHEFFSTLPELFAEFCIKCLREKVRPEHVLHHYEAHKLWAADCVTRHRHHDVALFESIEEFEREAARSDDRIHECAVVIYHKFLAETATSPVAIAPKLLAAVENELSSDTVGSDVFTAVREQVVQRMDDDEFRLFKTSRVFQDFLRLLHCPDVIFASLTPAQEELLSMHSSSTLTDRRRTLQHHLVTNMPAPKQAFGSGHSEGKVGSKVATVVASSTGSNDDDDMLATLGAHSRRSTNAGRETVRKLSTSFVF